MSVHQNDQVMTSEEEGITDRQGGGTRSDAESSGDESSFSDPEAAASASSALNRPHTVELRVYKLARHVTTGELVISSEQYVPIPITLCRQSSAGKAENMRYLTAAIAACQLIEGASGTPFQVVGAGSSCVPLGPSTPLAVRGGGGELKIIRIAVRCRRMVPGPVARVGLHADGVGTAQLSISPPELPVASTKGTGKRGGLSTSAATKSDAAQQADTLRVALTRLQITGENAGTTSVNI